jgi:hypothetical protein
MKLVDLEPVFVSHGGEGVTLDGQPVPLTLGVGLICRCPCGCINQLYVPFANPIGPGPLMSQEGWLRVGDSFEDLTLTPSIFRAPAKGGCGWHGFITQGEIRTV